MALVEVIDERSLGTDDWVAVAATEPLHVATAQSALRREGRIESPADRRLGMARGIGPFQSSK